MRIIIKTTPNTEFVSFDYQQKLVGTIHKWIGENNAYHGMISLYSFSWLQNGRMQDGGLVFPGGAKFFISFYDEDVIRDIVRSILNEPDMFCGMTVCDVSIVSDPDLSGKELFYLASPVFIHQQEEDGRYKHYTYNDERSSELMTETLRRKMKVAGLPDDPDFSVEFDMAYSGKRIKLMTYKGIKNKASMCPVIIKGTLQSKQFAWNVGIGNSTGIGFGAIY
ncbi:CRISPR-associated endoribonuclease Cas6 [Prevotella sp. PINT]|uniref:CRISPR-associated endoribonuclease Cas6 n=1 Tax=Palleniella intestinalis TaxID=2736291 RepID=UPI001557EB64|nr:CRISPR-associated endoribonuclease Cas6 [Palleniella intestinalis]NPD82150.1 CRISPR-associated endoribonuclease Cas6 [Palleniella intestinalis]